MLASLNANKTPEIWVERILWLFNVESQKKLEIKLIIKADLEKFV
jgi:hypothetical protein